MDVPGDCESGRSNIADAQSSPEVHPQYYGGDTKSVPGQYRRRLLLYYGITLSKGVPLESQSPKARGLDIT